MVSLYLIKKWVGDHRLREHQRASGIICCTFWTLWTHHMLGNIFLMSSFTEDSDR